MQEVLSEFLQSTGLRGQVFCQTIATAPWGLRMPSLPQVGLHIVARGSCWLALEGDETHSRLLPGDVVLLPHGAGHSLYDAPGSKLLDLEEWKTRKDRLDRLVRESRGGGEETHLLCGAYRFESGSEHPLVRLLPPVIHVESSQAPPGLERILRALREEFLRADIGGPTVVSRLLDVVFVEILRAWLDSGQALETGWLGALRDPRIATVLERLHHRPERAWTVSALAREIGLSRATFARRFRQKVGVTPARYLSQIRMDLALRLLRGTDEGLAVIARRVGYQSEFAFNRAFKNEVGVPPGRYRQGLPAPLPEDRRRGSQTAKG